MAHSLSSATRFYFHQVYVPHCNHFLVYFLLFTHVNFVYGGYALRLGYLTSGGVLTLNI